VQEKAPASPRANHDSVSNENDESESQYEKIMNKEFEHDEEL
jgi:hypothetical protein